MWYNDTCRVYVLDQWSLLTQNYWEVIKCTVRFVWTASSHAAFKKTCLKCRRWKYFSFCIEKTNTNWRSILIHNFSHFFEICADINSYIYRWGLSVSIFCPDYHNSIKIPTIYYSSIWYWFIQRKQRVECAGTNNIQLLFAISQWWKDGEGTMAEGWSSMVSAVPSYPSQSEFMFLKAACSVWLLCGAGHNGEMPAMVTSSQPALSSWWIHLFSDHPVTLLFLTTI